MAAEAARALNNIRRLRVVNLPWTVSDVQLKQYFSRFGFISSVRVIFDKNTGMSKNFGFVDIPQKETYDAIMNRDNHHIEGNDVYVRQWVE